MKERIRETAKTLSVVYTNAHKDSLARDLSRGGLGKFAGKMRRAAETVVGLPMAIVFIAQTRVGNRLEKNAESKTTRPTGVVKETPR